MRTTIILPDELYRQAKAAARSADRTFTSFLEEAVRRELARSEPSIGSMDVSLAPPSGSREDRPLVDLADKQAVQELLDEDDFTVRRIRRSQGGRE